MRPYTQEEYLKEYRKGWNKDPDNGPEAYWDKMTSDNHAFMFELTPPLCTCTRFDNDRGFEGCKNCLGYSTQPIPWSEVNK